MITASIITVCILLLGALYWYSQREISKRKTYDKGRWLAMQKELVRLQGNVHAPGDRPAHPFARDRIEKNIVPGSLAVNRITAMDSIGDFARGKCKIIDSTQNISAAGVTTWQIKALINMAADDARVHNHQVRYLIVGTGGNDFLWGRLAPEVIADMRFALDTGRDRFPRAKIIIIGLPPVFDVHLTQSRIAMEAEMIRWCTQNMPRAAYVSLTGLGNEFGDPKRKNSTDGIHLTDRGYEKLDEKIREAMKPGVTVVD